MAEEENVKKFDIVIFGASGFTGQFVVEEIARTEDEEGKITWAIAGRSMSKLQNVLKEAAKYTGKDLEEIPILIADVSSEASLEEMCKQAKIVLNCVGPYQLYGDAVVKACIENKAHQVDICGEPVFLEQAQLAYNAKAKEAGVYIMQSCGFDSIPADLGVTYTRDQFKGDLNHIEGYVALHYGPEGGCGNTGTWRSAILGFTNADKLKSIRKQLSKEPLPRGNFKMPKRSTIFYSDETSGWCVPFIGADRSIVMRSQRYNFEERKERPVQFNAYMKMPGLIGVIYVMLMGVIFGVFSKFSFGRTLLEKFPRLTSLGIFSSTGPTRKQMEGSSFTMQLIGQGHETKLDDISEQHEDQPKQKISTKVTGPEIGYVTTPICMVQAAYAMLKEPENLPEGGGVFTPGAAFAKTTLVERLTKHNVKFETVQQ